MKKAFLAIVLLTLCGSFSELKAQERKPAYQQTTNSNGLTPSEKLVQAEQSKTVTQRTLEGFNKGMERSDPGSSAAAAGTLLNNTLNKSNQQSTPPKSGTSANVSPQ